MKRIILLAISLMAGAMSVGAQSLEVMDAKSAYLKWGERKLEAGDFLPRKSADKEGNTMYSSIGWMQQDVTTKFGNLRFMHKQIQTLFDRQCSWAVADSLTELNLRYMQLGFDIEELYCRRVQNAYNAAEESVDYLLSSMESVVTKLYDESDGYKDEAVLEKYEKEVAALLETTPKEVQAPAIGPYTYGIGFYGNLRQAAFWGAGIKEQFDFDNPTGLEVGMRFIAGKSAYSLELMGGFGNIVNPMQLGAVEWPAGHDYEVDSVNLLYSYEALHGSWVDIWPFAGAGISQLLMFDVVPGQKDVREHARGLSLAAGADFRLKYFRFYNASGGYIDSAIYGRVFVAREAPKGIPAFNSINFGIGIDYHAGDRPRKR